MRTPRVAIISDDLTGALDAAAPFARAGWHTHVATSPSALGAALAAGGDVVAVSVNTREGDAQTARSRARNAAVALAHVPVIFKKIDSRMKGHILPEALEIAAQRALPRLLVCPAIPELGRYVAGGHIIGHGIERPIPIDLPQNTPCTIDYRNAGSDRDLDAIVADAQGALLVGARGLAAAVARSLGRAPVPFHPTFTLPLCFVIGSRDPVTLAQLAALRAALPQAHYAPAPDGVLQDADPRVHLPPITNPGVIPSITILQATLGDGRAAGSIVTARLAQSMARNLSAQRETLLFTGGETAAACLNAMGIGVLHLLGEVLPGMPISKPFNFPNTPYIITKSGGFGAADSLADIAHLAISNTCQTSQ